MSSRHAVKPTWRTPGPGRYSGAVRDPFLHGTGGWSVSRNPLPVTSGELLCVLLTLCLGALYMWAALLPTHPILPRSSYPAAFNDEPSVAGPLYHHHPVPTVPVWSWSNRLSDVYDDFFRITLHCDPLGSCHVEVESFRIR